MYSSSGVCTMYSSQCTIYSNTDKMYSGLLCRHECIAMRGQIAKPVGNKVDDWKRLIWNNPHPVSIGHQIN